MKNDKETLKFMFKDINARFERLNEREQNIFSSLEEWFIDKDMLTKKQEALLEKLYEKATENG